MLELFREVGEGILALAIRFGAKKAVKETFEVQLSFNPYIKASIENEVPELGEFKDVNAAVRTLKALDDILPESRQTVVVIDELEELNQEDRNALAFLIKQIGDQEFSTRFLLVGIAENVHELIGTHESVPRYLTEIPLKPLIAQDLIDIVADAAKVLRVEVPREFLFRIAIIEVDAEIPAPIKTPRRPTTVWESINCANPRSTAVAITTRLRTSIAVNGWILSMLIPFLKTPDGILETF